MNMVRKTAWSARSQNDQVVLRIGNADISMDYEDALRISQALRVAAKQSKKFAGDISRHWSVIATLTNAEQ